MNKTTTLLFFSLKPYMRSLFLQVWFWFLIFKWENGVFKEAPPPKIFLRKLHFFNINFYCCIFMTQKEANSVSIYSLLYSLCKTGQKCSRHLFIQQLYMHLWGWGGGIKMTKIPRCSNRLLEYLKIVKLCSSDKTHINNSLAVLIQHHFLSYHNFFYCHHQSLVNL